MKQKKMALRQEMKAIRKNLQAQADDMAVRRMAAHILRLPEVAGDVQRGIRASSNEPHIVAGYMPIHTEVDCLFILKALNAIQCRPALPVMNGKNRHLGFREWDMTEALKDEPYGTREPKSDRLYVMPDIILLPLLSFDERGRRLGYGGGFYDRTLKLYREKGHVFTAIGIAFDGQKSDHVPTNEYDQSLDIIVTEKKVYRP
ncbi:MAG: 5-formyltetrahydrofolate cyclo-ligase [Alphaproteobacteria bacterium]|nr:MAG: 5-formyltetrahydrofolate cyclo-ligase [Alphaproteobacteria bacterium]